MDIVSTSVEGSLSSSSTDGHRYDVFLSFRGVDTRHSFTDHLHKALVDANITTFLDDEKIETGEDLKPELERVIKTSRASIIVLSKNYASSTWCLDELVLILEQCVTSNHFVFPIFYHVEPTHVRHQLASFADAMAMHKKTMEAETDANKRSNMAKKLDRWTKALKEVADLKGMDVPASGRLETEVIKEIVQNIYRTLGMSSRISLPVLIGMNDSINFITSWLRDASSHTPDILTIFGMVGSGKTSLAKYVYELQYHEFETSSYIEDISRINQFKGLLDLQKRLYEDISESSISVHNVSTYTSIIEKVVARRKTLLVLDDIDSVDQLDALLGSRGFYPGSKIIITTSYASLTDRCLLMRKSVNPKHSKHLLEGLHETESRQLFFSCAFMSNGPKSGYEEVSDTIVNYCEGHPLALKVLGLSLRHQDVAFWKNYRKGLLQSGIQLPDIINSLRKSFDSLPSLNDKEMFMDIACFFVGMDCDVARIILEACDINTRSGMKNLMDRCLLSIGRNHELKMHPLLRDMGRFVVHQESPDKPWKRSRLCHHNDSFKVLKQKKGTINVRGLTLDMQMLEIAELREGLQLETDALNKMDNLKLLQLNYVKMNGSYENFPEELRWLCMHGFPSKSIPSNLPGNLVVLDMSYSNIKSFGVCYSHLPPHSRKKSTDSRSKDQRSLRSLKILNLSFNQRLVSLGGFAELPALERLIVRYCISLTEICESVEECIDLSYIDLSNCSNLEIYPRTLGMSKNVRTLLIDGCTLLESQLAIDQLQYTKTSSSAVLDTIPSDMKFFEISLPNTLVRLSLVNNNLSAESFPIDLSCLSMLKDLCLDDNPIVSLPSGVRRLPTLEILSMRNCKMLTSVEIPPRTLTHLNLLSDYKPSLQKVTFDSEMSPLDFMVDWDLLAPSSFKFQGMVTIQPIASVDLKILHSLGWADLEFLQERRVVNPNINRGQEESEIQIYYEFGIFSTIYGGEKMPDWIMKKSKGRYMSFTIPSSLNNLRGLNFCCVQKFRFRYECFDLPTIKICNTTKNHTWIYKHCAEGVRVGGYWVTLISHWMFGMEEMECGDVVTVTVRENLGQVIKCGVSFVYDDGEEDMLGYYKSWNHIIGGDLSAFQLTTGEYLLHTNQFMRTTNSTEFSPHFLRCGIADGASFKERKVWFRALPQRKSGVPVSHMRFQRMIDQRSSFYGPRLIRD